MPNGNDSAMLGQRVLDTTLSNISAKAATLVSEEFDSLVEAGDTLEVARGKICNAFRDANSPLSQKVDSLVEREMRKGSRAVDRTLVDANFNVLKQNLNDSVALATLNSLLDNVGKMHLSGNTFTPDNTAYLQKGLEYHLDENRRELNDTCKQYKTAIDKALEAQPKPDDSDHQALDDWNQRQEALKQMRNNLDLFIQKDLPPANTAPANSQTDAEKEEDQKGEQQQGQPPYESLSKKLRDRNLLDDKGIMIAMAMNIIFLSIVLVENLIVGTVARTLKNENDGPIEFAMNFFEAFKQTVGRPLGVYPIEPGGPEGFLKGLWEEIKFHAEEAGDGLSDAQRVAAQGGKPPAPKPVS